LHPCLYQVQMDCMLPHIFHNLGQALVSGTAGM
jgi:hypothetical protein